MSGHVTLNSSEAQTLYNTGRLIRTVDCDWQPPEVCQDMYVTQTSDGWRVYWGAFLYGSKHRDLTPPLGVGAVYDVKEPCCHRLTIGEEGKAVTYGWSAAGLNLRNYTAEEMPDHLVRQQATPTYKLIFEEGKLRWHEELKRV